jgi:CheY-like chemotaxis protein/HPt (histidine-containing phosphotransfer) domain-containing protein
MSGLRILHVDDEPDIRELVDISLGLDPELSVKSCCSGKDALAAAADWSPDLILMDVMMPVMDGPQTLSHLRDHARTAKIPVVFMTARAQARELAHFLSLGATGVVAKPFDPMTLARIVKQYLCTSVPNIEDLRRRFITRARSDAKTLVECRIKIGSDPAAAYERIERIAHSLSGAAGIYSFVAVGSAAAVLERVAEGVRNGIDSERNVEPLIDQLIEAITRDCHDTDDARPDVRSAFA